MNQTGATEIIIEEITIKGSAERIFEAVADPEQRIKWWGVKGAYESTEMDSDLRVGGRWIMKGLAMGKPFSCHGEYTKIERPRLLEFTWNPSWQADNLESLVRFDLNEKEGVTTVRVTHSGLTPAARDAHRGWPQVLSWLKAYVE
ncbi:MAG: SRPBCC domain-containing protein [Verrucomicrobia bacterium]|nr:SRPBCC domain-containing protein [Verrucomicrobiota bacterium]